MIGESCLPQRPEVGAQAYEYTFNIHRKASACDDFGLKQQAANLFSVELS